MHQWECLINISLINDLSRQHFLTPRATLPSTSCHQKQIRRKQWHPDILHYLHPCILQVMGHSSIFSLSWVSPPIASCSLWLYALHSCLYTMHHQPEPSKLHFLVISMWRNDLIHLQNTATSLNPLIHNFEHDETQKHPSLNTILHSFASFCQPSLDTHG